MCCMADNIAYLIPVVAPHLPILPTVPGRPERLENRPFSLAVLGASGLPGTVGKMVKWEGIIGMKFAILQEGLLGFMPKL